MLDRGLHDVGEAHGAEPLQRLAPGLERARHRHRFRPGQVFIADRIEHVMRRARFRFVGIGPDRQRHRALAVDEAMAAIGQSDVGHAAADDADHHRLDHRQREQRRDRGIDGVAAGGEHFGARTGRQRMIAHHHAAAAGRRLLLTLKAGGCAIPPMTRHAFFLLLAIVLIRAIVPLGSICPDDHNSIIGHHCNLTDSDNRDPLTSGSGWARLNERVTRRRRMRRSSCGVIHMPESHPEDLKCRRSY